MMIEHTILFGMMAWVDRVRVLTFALGQSLETVARAEAGAVAQPPTADLGARVALVSAR
jgi:hypothetical protein